MGLNSIGKLFMPKNKIFYNLFEEVAETVRIMGAVLKQLVNETDVDKRASLTTQLEDLELFLEIFLNMRPNAIGFVA